MTTTTAKRLTALELIADRCSTSVKAVEARRAAAATRVEANHTDMKSYREGEAAAYNDAYGVMKAELERLRGLWQNGSITYSDFTGI